MLIVVRTVGRVTELLLLCRQFLYPIGMDNTQAIGNHLNCAICTEFELHFMLEIRAFQ